MNESMELDFASKLASQEDFVICKEGGGFSPEPEDYNLLAKEEDDTGAGSSGHATKDTEGIKRSTVASPLIVGQLRKALTGAVRDLDISLSERLAEAERLVCSSVLAH